MATLDSPDSVFNETIFTLDYSNVTTANTVGNLAMKDMLANSRYIVQRILVPLVFSVGLLGNVVTIIVLTRRHMRSSTNNYLTALAVSDLLYLSFSFTLSLQHYSGIDHPKHWFYWHYFRYALWLTDASSSTSTWLTVAFTIERYIAVCHPIKGKVICTRSRAKKIILVVFLFCFSLTASTPHEWVVQSEEDGNSYRMTLALSELGAHETYKKTFYWFTAVTFIILPLVILAVFNSFLISAVNKSRVIRRSMTQQSLHRESSQTQENKITIMLIALVLLALFCQLPSAILLLYTSFHVSEPQSHAYYVERILGNVFNILTAVNAACNFLLYCAMSGKYRRTFMKTFFHRWYSEPAMFHSSVAHTTFSQFGTSSPYSMRMSSLRMSVQASQRGSGSSSPNPGQVPKFQRRATYLTVPNSVRAKNFSDFNQKLLPEANDEYPETAKMTSQKSDESSDSSITTLLNGQSNENKQKGLPKIIGSLKKSQISRGDNEYSVVIGCGSSSLEEQTAV